MTITRLSRTSQAGDVVRTGISRRTRRSGRQCSAVEHLARFEHRYGLSDGKAWVIPLCGAAAGRASFADTNDLCKSCAAQARKLGIEVEGS